MTDLFFHTFFNKFGVIIDWDFKKLDLLLPTFFKKKQELHCETYKKYIPYF